MMRPGFIVMIQKASMKASGITKAQKNTTSLQQCENDADLFLQFLQHSAS